MSEVIDETTGSETVSPITVTTQCIKDIVGIARSIGSKDLVS